MKRLLTILAFSAFTAVSNAQGNVTIDNITYNINLSMYVATVNQASQSCVGVIAIPDTITYNSYNFPVVSIDHYAFKNCKDISAIILPQTIKSIGSESFYGCTSLGTMILPDNVRDLGGHAFANCSNLSQVVLPKGIIDLYYGTFANCTSLKNVVIPENVEILTGDVFGGSGLTSINIPAKLTSLSADAFGGCGNLDYITVDSSNERYDSRDNSNAIIDRTNNALIAGSCRTIIPSTVVEVGSYAFYGRSGLTSISFPVSVKKINYCAFSKCDNLKSVFCYNRTPPTLTSGIWQVFPEELDFFLYVPKGCRSTYAYKWKMPEEKIIEMDEMSVNELADGKSAEPVAYYNEQGQAIDQPQKGIVIVCYKDGSVRKVMVK